MPTPTDAEIDAAIREAAVAPRRASNETGSVEAHPLPDMIEADRYARSKTAATSPRRGVRVSRFVPPGAS